MMDPEFYSRVADEFGGYTSGGLRTTAPECSLDVRFDQVIGSGSRA